MAIIGGIPHFQTYPGEIPILAGENPYFWGPTLSQVFVPLPSGMSTSVPSLTVANAETFEPRTGRLKPLPNKCRESWRPERWHFPEKMWMLILKQADRSSSTRTYFTNVYSNHRDFAKKRGGISERPRGIYRASNTSPWVSWSKYAFGMLW